MERVGASGDAAGGVFCQQIMIGYSSSGDF